MVNKIDLPSAEPYRVLNEVEEAIGLDCTDHSLVSAKTGEGVKELLETIVRRVPAPSGDENAPTKALIYYDRLGLITISGPFRFLVEEGILRGKIYQRGQKIPDLWNYQKEGGIQGLGGLIGIQT